MTRRCTSDICCENDRIAAAHMPQSTPLSTRPHLMLRLLRRAAPLLAGVLLLSTSLAQAPPTPPPQKLQKLRIVGGLADLNQYTRNEAPFWTQTLARLSAGKYDADIVPFDRAGVPGADMLRLIQLGVVPFGTALLSSRSARYPQYN